MKTVLSLQTFCQLKVISKMLKLQIKKKPGAWAEDKCGQRSPGSKAAWGATWVLEEELFSLA